MWIEACKLDADYVLDLIVGIENNSISKAKTERIDKQYYLDFVVSDGDAKQSIESAEDFISEIKDVIDRLNNKKIEEFHNKAIELLM